LHFREHENTTAAREKQIRNEADLRNIFDLIFHPLDPLFNIGKLLLSVDGQTWQCYPVVCTSTADYFENIHLHSIKQPHADVWKAPKLLFGGGYLSLWQLRDDQLHFQLMILVTQGN